MIPKKIHYCWFGGNAKPKKMLQMIDSWRRVLPDYEIKEWNEGNFNVNINRYSREAYHSRKWAFVSDVARIYALYHQGGIYLDTDVEMLRTFDDLLDNRCFLGFESLSCVGTAVIGCEAGNQFIKMMLDSYSKRAFIKTDGMLDETTNVSLFTRSLYDMGLRCNGEKQNVSDVTVYPKEYFTPYDYLNGKLSLRHDTYSIHWFEQSWIPRKYWINALSRFYHRVVGVKMN